MTDYHKSPVLSVRIDADLKAFALAEADRPGVTLGAVVNEALADLRAKRRQVNHVVNPPRRARKSREAPAPVRPEAALATPFVAAEPDQSQRPAHKLNCSCLMCKPPKEGKR